MAYTPIFDSLFTVKGINLTDAAVFGAVWRYAQGELKKCIASPKTIAEGLGLSVNTVRTSLKKLCQELKLLEDLTPEANSKAHEYIPTEKALAIIAREIKREKESPEPEPILTEEEQGRVPKLGTQELVPSEDGVPEVGKGGYQVLVGGVPSFGTKESINKDSIQERESPAHEDYLALVVNGQGQIADKSNGIPEDQYFEYRSEFLSIYQEMTGEYPDLVIKNEIPKLVEAGATPESWRESWRQCKLKWTGRGKVPADRVIEVCAKFGGDYEKWRRATYPDNTNGRDSPGFNQGGGSVEIRTIKTADGGLNL